MSQTSTLDNISPRSEHRPPPVLSRALGSTAGVPLAHTRASTPKRRGPSLAAQQGEVSYTLLDGATLAPDPTQAVHMLHPTRKDPTSCSRASPHPLCVCYLRLLKEIHRLQRAPPDTSRDTGRISSGYGEGRAGKGGDSVRHRPPPNRQPIKSPRDPDLRSFSHESVTQQVRR